MNAPEDGHRRGFDREVDVVWEPPQSCPPHTAVNVLVDERRLGQTIHQTVDLIPELGAEAGSLLVIPELDLRQILLRQAADDDRIGHR